MTSPTVKDIFKAVAGIFSASDSSDALPPDLQLAIESFLDSNREPDDRIQEELLAVYNKYVAEAPQKHGLFLLLLKMMRPAIQNEKHLLEWWNMVLQPTLTTIGYRREEIQDTRDILLSMLVFDADHDPNGDLAHLSTASAKLLIEEYLSRTRISSGIPDPDAGTRLRENEFIATEIESIITSYGRKKPKELLVIIDEFYAQKQHRLQVLSLLSAFIQTQPPHLHLVLHTPLWENLQRCLMTETSSAIIEVALTVFVMFLPHTAGNLEPYLPKMYLIYARILCWDRFQVIPSSPEEDDRRTSTSGQSVAASLPEAISSTDNSRSSNRPQPSAPCLLHYFTFLYGLFPFNFLSFVRKPRKWLKRMNFPDANDFDIDQGVLHERTKSFQQAHLLHPNFYTTTLEDELEDNRWLKSDPADVVAVCMGLCVAVPSVLSHLAPPGPPPSSKLPELPHNRIPSGEPSSPIDSTERGPESDSPTLPPQSGKKPVEPLNDESLSPKSPTLTRLVTSPSSQSLPALHKTSRLDAQPQNSIGQSPTVEYLQREITLLRNDLNFERYLKQQHVSHIGQLQRRNLKEATVEAETQNIINTNRMLKAKLNKASELYTQLKKEMTTSRNQSKRWEADLSAKIRVFREEEKKWRFDEQTLRLELSKAREDCDRLKDVVLDSETRELNSKQRLQASRMDIEELENFKQEVETLRAALSNSRRQEQDFERAKDERDHFRTELEDAKMKLASRNAERERTARAYETRIEELERRMQGLNMTVPGQLPPAVQQMVDSALAASNAKLLNLRKIHARLHDRYIELEGRYHDLEHERDAMLVGRPILRSRSPTVNNYYDDSIGSLSPGEYTGSHVGKPRLLSLDQLSEDDDYYRSHYAATSPPSDAFSQYNRSARPVRLESLRDAGGYAGGDPKILSSARDSSLPRNSAIEYEGDLDSRFYSPNTGMNRRPTSRGDHSISQDSAASGEQERRKEKIQPKSQVRVYGRGGQQNIGKTKDKSKDKDDKGHKTGGFRGLRGIM